MSADSASEVTRLRCRPAPAIAAAFTGAMALWAGLIGSTPAWAAASTTIYRNTLKDGSVEFSDRPAGAGAANAGQSTYVVPDAAEALRRADAEREYWRKQAEAFDKRNQEREAQAAAAATRRAQVATQPARVWSYDPELLPRTVYYVNGRPMNRMVAPQIVPGAGYAPTPRPSVGSAVPFGLPYRPGGLSR